jgi:hypothetical protein
MEHQEDMKQSAETFRRNGGDEKMHLTSQSSASSFRKRRRSSKPRRRYPQKIIGYLMNVAMCFSDITYAGAKHFSAQHRPKGAQFPYEP